MNKRSIMKHEHKMHHTIIPSYPVHLGLTQKKTNAIFFLTSRIRGKREKLDVHT